MKRTGNLFEKIIDIPNLYKAERKARRGKGDREEIIQFVNRLSDNISLLHKELFEGTYSTGEYYHFTIYEPKSRLISRLPYRDRVVHHAILNVLEPFFLKSFINTSYSCIKNRGIHKCLKDLNKAIKDVNSRYCLKLDIKKFYPSVDHSRLGDMLEHKFKDKKVLNLLTNIIESIKGLPLGSYTSQWLGNFYLNKFDHWLKEEKSVSYYFRYCDDMVILHHSKEYLHQLRKEIEQYLEKNLNLALSNYQVFPISTRGIDFVGYVSYPTHIRIRKSIKQAFKRMLVKYPNRKSIASYKGWLLHGNCRNLENKYLSASQA